MAKSLRNATNKLVGTPKLKEAPKTKEDTAIEMFAEEKEEKKKTKKTILDHSESKSVRMQILLRPSTKKALQRLALNETDGSINELINRICDDYIEANLEPED